MATVLDYLNAPEFTDDRITEAINVAEYTTGRPAQLGIFRDVSIPTTYVKLSVSEDEIAIIPSGIVRTSSSWLRVSTAWMASMVLVKSCSSRGDAARFHP